MKIEGKEPGDRYGVDTNAAGGGTIAEHRLYQLFRQKGAVDDHTLKLNFLMPALKRCVYVWLRSLMI